MINNVGYRRYLTNHLIVSERLGTESYISVIDGAVCFFPSQLRMFHLIEFLINKTVAVVPQNWCRDGVAYWPNYRSDESVDRAVKNAEEPGPDWNTYDVRVIKSCGTLILKRIF